MQSPVSGLKFPDALLLVGVALQKNCGTKRVPRGTFRVPNGFFWKNIQKNEKARRLGEIGKVWCVGVHWCLRVVEGGEFCRYWRWSSVGLHLPVEGCRLPMGLGVALLTIRSDTNVSQSDIVVSLFAQTFTRQGNKEFHEILRIPKKPKKAGEGQNYPYKAG